MLLPQTVLHVDDDPDDRFLVSSAIHNINSAIKVLEAENGLKALELLRKAKMAGDLPCLVILDYNMPLMNGMETYKEIRKHPEFNAIPVVLLSTHTSKKEDHFWNNENVATFTKPATFKELAAKIQKILNYAHPFSA